MLIIGNTLHRIYPSDIIDGCFTAPNEVLYIGYNITTNISLKKMILPNVIEIYDYFLFTNNSLTHLEIPNVEKIGDNFLFWNKCKLTIEMSPNIKEIGEGFLLYNTEFKYTHNILKALNGDLHIGGEKVDKNEYIRKLNLKKILC